MIQAPVILLRTGNSLYIVWYRLAAGVVPIFRLIYTAIIQYTSVRDPPCAKADHLTFIFPVYMFSDRYGVIIQYLTTCILVIFCLKIFHPNGNKEHLLFSSMVVYITKTGFLMTWLTIVIGFDHMTS